MWNTIMDGAIQVVGTAALLATAAWLMRNLIATRLTQSVKSEFDKKIENLRSDLRTKESRIDALQDGALSGLVSRQSKIYEKQIEAIEHLWEAKRELDKLQFISASMSTVKFEESAKAAPTEPKLRKMFEIIGGKLELADLNLESAEKARPFISELAWAYFSAYRSILLLAFTKLDVLRKGVDSPGRFFELDGDKDLLKSILPHHSHYIDKHGDSHEFLNEIEELLLSEFKNIQAGNESDRENTERAAVILRESKKLSDSIGDISPPPTNNAESG